MTHSSSSPVNTPRKYGRLIFFGKVAFFVSCVLLIISFIYSQQSGDSEKVYILGVPIVLVTFFLAFVLVFLYHSRHPDFFEVIRNFAHSQGFTRIEDDYPAFLFSRIAQNPGKDILQGTPSQVGLFTYKKKFQNELCYFYNISVVREYMPTQYAFEFEMPERFSCVVVVNQPFQPEQPLRIGKMKVESWEFNNRYKIFTTSRVKALEIFDPIVIQMLLSMNIQGIYISDYSVLFVRTPQSQGPIPFSVLDRFWAESQSLYCQMRKNVGEGMTLG